MMTGGWSVGHVDHVIYKLLIIKNLKDGQRWPRWSNVAKDGQRWPSKMAKLNIYILIT